jgi:hypothetical protein
MKGKQAILRYLETHRTFTAKDVATECGMTINCITKNASIWSRARKIVRVSKVWRTVTYRLATPEEQAAPRAAAPTEYFRSAATVRR